MNVQTDVLVANQCGLDSEETFEYRDHSAEYLNSGERGVGRNRNVLLDRATADICIFADDDLRFVDGYAAIASKAFAECPDADVLLFNLIEKNPRRYINNSIFKVGYGNYARYGAARTAFRRSAICSKGIRFNTEFGGGTRYGSGEDTIFLQDCLRAGLNLYAVPYALAEIDQNASSTWFKGYNKKFFFDKGALYACLHPVAWLSFCIRYVLRYSYKYRDDYSMAKALRAMCAGAIDYKRTHAS